MATPKKGINFEKSLETLENIVETLEQGELSLEDSLQAFEKGIQLTRECQKSLNNAEQRVSKLVKQDMKEQLTPFQPEEGE